MTLIEFGRVPLVRRLVRRVRAIEVGVAAVGEDTGLLLQSMELSLTSISDLQARAVECADEIEGLGRESRLTVNSAGHAVIDRLSAVESRLANELELLHGRVDEVLNVKLVTQRPTSLVDPFGEHPNQSWVVDGQSVELALCAHLAPFLHEPRAMDIGAHRGAYSIALLEQGLEVVAVEPNAELASGLRNTLAGRGGAVVREAAMSDGVREAVLYMAEDKTGGDYGDTTLYTSLMNRADISGLHFAAGPTVQTMTVEALRGELDWPETIGLIKVDVEGAELRVLAGLGATRPEVAMVEYWGPDYLLVVDPTTAGVASLIGAMQRCGLRRWITFMHDSADGVDRVAYSVNDRRVPPRSWGNVAFFRDRDTFLAALRWCQSTLPEAIGANVIAP